MVTASGRIARGSNSDVDKSGTSQISQVAARQVFRALALQLVGDLITRRQGRVRRRFLANHDRPHSTLVAPRPRGPAYLQPFHNIAPRRSNPTDAQAALARHL